MLSEQFGLLGLFLSACYLTKLSQNPYDSISQRHAAHKRLCIVGPEISCSALMSLGLVGPRRPDREFLCPLRIFPTQQARLPTQREVAFSRTGCSPPGPQPNACHLPASPQNYSNRQITSPQGNQGITPCSCRPASHGLCCHSAPRRSPCVALCGVLCPPPGLYG